MSNWVKIYHSPAKPGTVPSHWAISEPESWTGGLTSPTFYAYSMMLNTSIWNTDTASNKGYPVLRGMPDAVEVFAFEGDIQMRMTLSGQNDDDTWGDNDLVMPGTGWE